MTVTLCMFFAVNSSHFFVSLVRLCYTRASICKGIYRLKSFHRFGCMRIRIFPLFASNVQTSNGVNFVATGCHNLYHTPPINLLFGGKIRFQYVPKCFSLSFRVFRTASKKLTGFYGCCCLHLNRYAL